MSWRFIKGLGAAETQRLRGGEERRGEGEKGRQCSSLFVFLSPWILVSLLGFISPCATVIGLTQSREDARRPPNFVIIFADDLGYSDIGSFGAAGYKTPNLDRMAREGARLTDFYVAQAVCSASRAALLTGSYPNRVGIQGALNHRAEHGINDREMTIAEILKTRGYATAIFGKWHLGHHPQFLPTRHGFDEYFGLPYSNDMWPNNPSAPKGFYPDLPLIENEKVAQLAPDQTQLTTWYTEHAVKFIEKSKDKPFFLYDALYFYWGRELHAVRSGKWKLHLPHPYQHLEQAGGDGKPGLYVSQEQELALFDLEKDVGETTNVAGKNPDVVKKLMTFVERARADLGDALVGREGKNVREPGRLAASGK
jgi:Sulfatase